MPIIEARLQADSILVFGAIKLRSSLIVASGSDFACLVGSDYFSLFGRETLTFIGK